MGVSEKGVGQGGEGWERGNRVRVSCGYILYGPVDGNYWERGSGREG